MSFAKRPRVSLKAQLDAALLQLGLDPKTAELDHDPALGLRYRDPVTGRYEPDANDPHYLKWRPSPEHDKKTFKDNGSGRGDLTAIAHVRRGTEQHREHVARMGAKAQGAEPPRPARRKRSIPSRPFPKGQRPLRSRNDLRRRKP
jgi:hypothetical protein